MKTILAADIGGTQSRLYVADLTADGFSAGHQSTYSNKDFESFSAVLKQFLSETHKRHITAACIAVAGPILHQRVQMTNLPWQLDASDLATQFAIQQVTLINDFAAQVYGLDQLAENDFCVLQAGEQHPHGLRTLIGAGTGLGVALGIYSAADRQRHCLPSQGGNSGFAPVNAEQLALWQSLYLQYGSVSNEMLLSGNGIQRIFQYALAQTETDNDESLQHWSAADITQAALQKKHPAAEIALQYFIEIYASVAANLALTTLPQGGLYISGGIAPKILQLLQEQKEQKPKEQHPKFIEAFLHHPSMREVLKTIPVRIILNEHCGLLGARYLALKMAQQCDHNG